MWDSTTGLTTAELAATGELAGLGDEAGFGEDAAAGGVAFAEEPPQRECSDKSAMPPATLRMSVFNRTVYFSISRPAPRHFESMHAVGITTECSALFSRYMYLRCHHIAKRVSGKSSVRAGLKSVQRWNKT